MDKVTCTGPMVNSILVSSKKIKDMGKEDSYGKMDVSTKAAGTKESSTEQDFTLTIMELSAKANGWRESARNG